MGTIAKSDVELVEASRRGEHEAFGHLVERYQDVVCAVSYSSTGDQGLSEDVAQETFIAAWRQLDRLRDVVRLGPWLCGIARNLGRKAHKRRRREEILDDKYLAPGGNPFDAAVRGDVERVVRESLARVPENYREVLVLYYCENQSVRDVAVALGTSETAVMQRLSRGRRYLADSLSEIVEGSLRSRRPRRDLVAAVLAAIVLIPIPSRVDASPPKGSTTMLKFAAAASAVVVAGTTAYFVYSHQSDSSPAATVAKATISPVLRFGGGQLGLAHAPSLGPTTAPRAILSRSVAEADLGYLPADADTVIGVNFALVRQSALWQRFVTPELPRLGGLQDVEALCGFDPLDALGSISIGLKGLGADDDTSVSGTIVVHGFEKTKAMTCFDKTNLDKAKRDGAKITIDNGVVHLSDAEASFHWAFTFIDDTTALIVLGPDAATKEGVARIAAGNGTLATSSTFAATLRNVNTDSAMWLMVSAQSKMLDDALMEVPTLADVKPGNLYLSLGVTDSLALDAGVGLGAPAAVARVVSYMKAQLSEGFAKTIVASYFDQLDVFADGSDLIVSLAISGDQIAQVLAMAKSSASDVVGEAE
ncbi:MAG: sigma-70 family RNA polymerase sigma factor [Myxococcota bacterium]|nr:sigma-70 family RNA polymerase sigma factor [Myxococcota bacterium]